MAITNMYWLPPWRRLGLSLYRYGGYRDEVVRPLKRSTIKLVDNRVWLKNNIGTDAKLSVLNPRVTTEGLKEAACSPEIQ